MSVKRYWPLQNVWTEAERPVDSEIGPWTCSCEDDSDVYSDFMEMHRATSGTQKIVFRVSTFKYGRIDLGECVILDKSQIVEIRDLLNAHLEQFESEGEDEVPDEITCQKCGRSGNNKNNACWSCGSQLIVRGSGEDTPE